MSTAAFGYPTDYRNGSFLWIEKSAPSLVQAGRSYEYLNTMTNLTDRHVKNVWVKDWIPAGCSGPGHSVGRGVRYTRAAELR